MGRRTGKQVRVAAVAGGALLAAACGGGGRNADTIASSSTTVAAHTTVQSVNDAVAIAQRSLTLHMADNDVRVLIVDLCAAGATGNRATITTDLTGLSLSTDAALRTTITALGRAAEAYCPDAVLTSRTLLTDLYAAVSPSVTAPSATTKPS